MKVKCWISGVNFHKHKKLYIAENDYNLVMNSQYVFIVSEYLFSCIQGKIIIVSNRTHKMNLYYNLFIKPDMSPSERTKLLLKSHSVERI